MREIFALPLNQVYVKLTQKYIDYLCGRIANEGGTEEIFRNVKYDLGYFYRLKDGKRCSLKLLFTLYNYFALDLKKMNKNIVQIVSGSNNSIGIDNPFLPFYFDNRFGGVFLGAIMGDGSRTKLGGVTYNNQNEIIVNNVLIAAKNIFGDVKYSSYDKQDGTKQLNFPKIIGDIIGLFGIEKSYKTVSDCYVELDKFSDEFKKGFIQQFFDDEGNVRKSDRRLQVKQTRNVNKNRKVIRKNIEKYAPKVLLNIKKVLQEFDIHSTISIETLRNENSIKKADFALNIYGKENLLNFQNKIGFKINYKRALMTSSAD